MAPTNVKKTSRKRAKAKPRRMRNRVEAVAELNTIVPRAEFAALAGRTRSAISHAARPGGPLNPAIRPGGIDTEDPSAIVYIASGPEGDLRGELLRLLVAKRRGEVRRIDLANARADGSLIPREFVTSHMIGGWDASNRRILTDATRTLVTRLYAMRSAGATREAGEAEARQILSSHMSLGLGAAKKAIVDAR
jgi:hypothetical protein